MMMGLPDMAIKRPGPYTPLSAHYADDERIMDAGEYAELMYIRILAYCGRTPKTEGWISDKQIRTRIGLETIPETGLETAPENRVEKLAEVGLLRREGSGYRVTSWLKWNMSAEQIARIRNQDRQRKAPPTSAKTGTGTGKQSGNGTGNRSGTSSGIQQADTDTDTDTDTRVTQRAATPSTQTLIGEWIDHSTTAPPGAVKGQIAKEISRMLDEGIDYEQVRAGLAEWNAKDVHPSVLPSIVHGVGNRRNGSRRQAETDDLFGRAMERAQTRDAAS